MPCAPEGIFPDVVVENSGRRVVASSSLDSHIFILRESSSGNYPLGDV
jgi:hypothetical protein